MSFDETPLEVNGINNNPLESMIPTHGVVPDVERHHQRPRVERKSKFHHLWILLLLSFPMSSLAYMIFVPNFLYNVPNHRCKLANESNTNESFTNNSVMWNQTVQMDPQCQRLANTTKNPIGSVETEGCLDGWQYSKDMGVTVVTEFDLVCDDAWKRPTIQCIFMIGLMIGSLLGGTLSDRFGRRVVLLSSFLGGGLLLLILSFSHNYWCFVAVIFFLGAIHILTYSSIFIMAQESVPEHQRALAALGINFSFGIGFLYVPLAGYFIKDWRWLLRIVSIARCAYFPLLALLLKESPMWLDQTRRKSQVVSSDRKQLNKKLSEAEVEDITALKMLKTSLLCSNSVLRNRLLMACFLWNVTFLCFYTLSLNSANLGGNIYINCVFGALVDMASYLCMFLLLRKTGRRNSLSLCIFISGAFCLLTPPLRPLNETVGVAASMIGRFFVTTSMSIAILFTGEMFPTLLRNTSVGIASMSARIGSALSPYLIFSGEMIDLAIPFYVMGILAIIGSFFTLILPETSNAPLPDTLKDALALNKYRLDIIRRRKSWFAKT
uniref:Solute carrier family 22 member 4-like n=1 Tax=Phallusia mammillata TaxID=59560 RepID=A0A6F9DTF8_9ASCI|nr:solute carrier family 22 member 4-like [Phallusia mammillata]